MTPSAKVRHVGATPTAVSTSLDVRSVHLWRIRYARSDRRAPLRRLLAGYLGLPEAEVELTEDTRGKPRLTPALALRADGRRLEFNWSHSGAYALVALSLDTRIGVDIEKPGPRPRALAFARRFFRPDEAEALARMDDALRGKAFLDLWCAKEAVLKASGVGLSFGLERLAFTHGRQGWDLAWLDPALGEVDRWHLVHLAPAPGYHGAVAWCGALRRVIAHFEASRDG